MAYYSGQVASYQELLNVLVAACVEQGWIWADGILSKNNVSIKFQVNNTPAESNGPGLIAQIGTGQSGSNLINPATSKQRIGKISSAGWGAIFDFPLIYNIHIQNNALDEVYCVINHSVDTYQYLAFGHFNSLDYGAWISATTGLRYSSETANRIVLTPSFDGPTWVYSKVRAIFWMLYVDSYSSSQTVSEVVWDQQNNIWLNDAPQRGVELSAYLEIHGLIQRQPSNWSSNAILLPINIYTKKNPQKNSLIFSLFNARYIRIDNYEPDQIINLNGDRWKVYPFYKKNINDRDNIYSGGHSGTFGWAIRYDGP